MKGFTSVCILVFICCYSGSKAGAQLESSPAATPVKSPEPGTKNMSDLPERGKNVLGQFLEDCSQDPMTGFYRDGCCRTSKHDRGSHTVCCMVSEEFLLFSRAQGNDLMTPAPQYGFPGLKPGDQWCLCAARWKEAYDAGAAPPIRLEATHERALEVVPIEALLEYALSTARAQ